MFIIGSLVASVTFSFTDIILFEGNEVGAKVFYILSMSALYIVLPGILKYVIILDLIYAMLTICVTFYTIQGICLAILHTFCMFMVLNMQQQFTAGPFLLG